MRTTPLLRTVDAVTVPVPDLDQGLAFYSDRLGHDLLWRNEGTGQAGLRLPEGGTELVLSTRQEQAACWLVDSVGAAVAEVVAAGGTLLSAPEAVPVGRLAVVADPFGNALVLIEESTGRYETDGSGRVTGVTPAG